MTLAHHLTTLEASGLIRLAAVQPELEYLFRHALVQDAAYESLLRADRRVLHKAVGEALERLYPNRQEELYGVLARHFAAAGEQAKGILYARRAAQKAKAGYAYDEAVQHLQTALTLLEPNEQIETRLTLLEELADVQVIRGEHPAAIPLYREALGLWDGQADKDKWIAMRLHRKIVEAVAHMIWLADAQRFEPMLAASTEIALKLTEREPPHPETVRLLTALSYNAWGRQTRTDWDAAERYAQAAVSLAEQLDAPVELAAALGQLAHVFGARGRLRERVEVARRQQALSQDPRFGDLRERARILSETGYALHNVGDYAHALPFLLESENLSRQIQAIDQLVMALSIQGRCWLHLDRWDEMLKVEAALRALEQSIPNFRERFGALCRFNAECASVYALRGEFDQASSRREQAFTIMVARVGPPEAWEEEQHY